jgi:hypothetical protein
MKKNIFLLALCVSALQMSCSNGPKQDDDMKEESADTTAQMNEQAEFQFDLTVSNVPTPFKLMEDITRAELKFDKEMLNPSTNAEQYTTSKQKALNFGVYNIDLGYLAAFNQNQEVIRYFVKARKLAKELGAGPFYDEIAKSVQLQSMNDKDQMLALFDKAYTASDKYLRSNQRLVSASLMLVGGWVESQYVALQSLKDQPRNSKTEPVYSWIAEQKPHIGNIAKLLEELKSEKDVADIIDPIKEIESLYSGIDKDSDLTADKTKQLTEKITEVRNSFVK